MDISFYLDYIGPIAFALIQIFAIIMIFVLRYHFRAFSLPGDKRARAIGGLFTFGVLAFILASGFLAYLTF